MSVTRAAPTASTILRMLRNMRTVGPMTPTTIQATDTARQIGQLLDRASRGETFLITRYGRPYATLTPPVTAPVPAAVAVARNNLTRYEALADDAAPAAIEVMAGVLAASLRNVLEIIDPDGASAP